MFWRSRPWAGGSPIRSRGRTAWSCGAGRAASDGTSASFPPGPPPASRLHGALGYYAAANRAKRIACRTEIAAGLGDTICPPSGICVLCNNLKVPKQLEFIQGRTHGDVPPVAQKFVLTADQEEPSWDRSFNLGRRHL